MNITPRPPWNSEDKDQSVLNFAEWLNEQARLTFLKDHTHAEIFFLMDEEGEGGLLPVPPNCDKDQLASLIRQQIAALGVYAFVHVAETWTYVPSAVGDGTPRQLVEGSIETRRLEPGSPAEALMVHVESRGGLARLWLSPIVRGPGQIALADAVLIEQGPSGRFAGLFGAPPSSAL